MYLQKVIAKKHVGILKATKEQGLVPDPECYKKVVHFKKCRRKFCTKNRNSVGANKMCEQQHSATFPIPSGGLTGDQSTGERSSGDRCNVRCLSLSGGGGKSSGIVFSSVELLRP